jgi:hypothetical protein
MRFVHRQIVDRWESITPPTTQGIDGTGAYNTFDAQGSRSLKDTKRAVIVDPKYLIAGRKPGEDNGGQMDNGIATPHYHTQRVNIGDVADGTFCAWNVKEYSINGDNRMSFGTEVIDGVFTNCPCTTGYQDFH